MATKDRDKNASKRFVMQTSEMTRGTTTAKGAQAGRDLMKHVRNAGKGGKKG